MTTTTQCNCQSVYPLKRCDRHLEMLAVLHKFWWGPFPPESPRDRLKRDLTSVRIWNRSDGYGPQGFMPDQGYDWSGIRDSSPAAIEAMFKELPS